MTEVLMVMFVWSSNDWSSDGDVCVKFWWLKYWWWCLCEVLMTEVLMVVFVWSSNDWSIDGDVYVKFWWLKYWWWCLCEVLMTEVLMVMFVWSSNDWSIDGDVYVTFWWLKQWWWCLCEVLMTEAVMVMVVFPAGGWAGWCHHHLTAEGEWCIPAPWQWPLYDPHYRHHRGAMWLPVHAEASGWPRVGRHQWARQSYRARYGTLSFGTEWLQTFVLPRNSFTVNLPQIGIIFPMNSQVNNSRLLGLLRYHLKFHTQNSKSLFVLVCYVIPLNMVVF